MRQQILCWALWLIVAIPAAADGNRHASITGPIDPYWVGTETAKLTVHQWAGEDVDAVFVLAIDDMRDPTIYDEYLRPIIHRLKRYQGFVGLSIMTNRVDPYDPLLAHWQQQGVSIEVHTLTHPCPLLQGGKLYEAKRSYDACVDLLARIPGPGPVAYRMPCCDSMNSVSPRFFDLIFNSRTPNGRFLQIDSSVFCVLDSADPDLPDELVTDWLGRSRFRKYIPVDRWLANLIDNYPYPYVIGRLAWEIPCLMPSDWDAQYLHGPNNPATVRDWQAALRALTLKGGTASLVFHPWNWIENDQVVELIEYAEQELKGRVRFLSFQQVLDRLNRHLLDGHPLRRPDGADNGVRLLDVNGDGFMDVLIGNERCLKTRIWDSQRKTWKEYPLPVSFVGWCGGSIKPHTVIFGVLSREGQTCMIYGAGGVGRMWVWTEQGWQEVPKALALVERPDSDCGGKDAGLRLFDIDSDGITELIEGGVPGGRIYRWDPAQRRWRPLPFRLPGRVTIVDAQGRDSGFRFVDIDGDRRYDIIYSDPFRCAVFLYKDRQQGWRCVLDETRAEPMARATLPPFVRLDGSNNGVWFRDGYVWIQNEETGGRLKNHVFRMKLSDLLTP